LVQYRVGPGPAPLAITLLHPSETARPRAVVGGGSCSQGRIQERKIGWAEG